MIHNGSLTNVIIPDTVVRVYHTVNTMEVRSPKRTIIINTFNPKLLCSVSNKPVHILPDKSIIKVEPGTINRKGRKRSLEHLSYEEKILRK